MIENLLLVIIAIVGSILTFYVNHQLKQGPVRSSAMLSLAVATFFYLFPSLFNEHLTKNIPVVFIGGSFIGMVSKKMISSYFSLFISAVVFAVIYLNASTFFNGYGGALGASAGISLLSVLSLPFISPKKHQRTNGILQLRKLLFGRNKN